MADFDDSLDIDKQHDLDILNTALYYEHQGIWAYDFAADKLSDSEVGKAVLAIALENQADHKQHRNQLSSAIRKLGGTPVAPEASYDLSAYLNRGEGNLDTDVNIAKLALALETDAAIAYVSESAKLKTPALAMTGAGIGCVESGHAVRIRCAFQGLGMEIAAIPTAVMGAGSREQWILKT